jgi:hypothetical protein
MNYGGNRNTQTARITHKPLRKTRGEVIHRESDRGDFISVEILKKLWESPGRWTDIRIHRQTDTD